VTALRDGPTRPAFVAADATGFGEIESAFAIALHMHQPLIPGGSSDLHTPRRSATCNGCWPAPASATTTARAFLLCCKRMAEFVPQLLRDGLRPRVMLEYSGTLLHGLRQMGADDVLDALVAITRTRPTVRRPSGWFAPGVTPSRPRL
jgi:hypothetical protein